MFFFPETPPVECERSRSSGFFCFLENGWRKFRVLGGRFVKLGWYDDSISSTSCWQRNIWFDHFCLVETIREDVWLICMPYRFFKLEPILDTSSFPKRPATSPEVLRLGNFLTNNPLLPGDITVASHCESDLCVKHLGWSCGRDENRRWEKKYGLDSIASDYIQIYIHHHVLL